MTKLGVANFESLIVTATETVGAPVWGVAAGKELLLKVNPIGKDGQAQFLPNNGVIIARWTWEQLRSNDVSPWFVVRNPGFGAQALAEYSAYCERVGLENLLIEEVNEQ